MGLVAFSLPFRRLDRSVVAQRRATSWYAPERCQVGLEGGAKRATTALDMRLLFLCSQPPSPVTNGGTQRLYYHLRALSRAHEVTLAFVVSGAPDTEQGDLYESCRHVVRLTPSQRCLSRPFSSHHRVGLPPARRFLELIGSPRPGYVQGWHDRDLIAQMRALLTSGPYDGIWVERSYLASAAGAAGIRADVVDVDDIDSVIFQKRLGLLGRYKSWPIDWAELMKMRAYEWSLTYRYPAVVVCKEEDRRFFAHPSRCHVLPNGAHIPPAASLRSCPTVDLLFLGTMSYRPNIDALHWFVDGILPLVRARRPATTLCVAGRSAGALADLLAPTGGCTIISDPPVVDQLYQQARVVVVPMRQGSGMCIKSIEALAFARPLVATSAGTEGLGLEDRRHARIADAPEPFAEACVDLLTEQGAAEIMGARGRQHVERDFSWDACAAKATTLMESVVRDRPPTT
jgi:glycosyltransferase involved in cell wall biosynthesis